MRIWGEEGVEENPGFLSRGTFNYCLFQMIKVTFYAEFMFGREIYKGRKLSPDPDKTEEWFVFVKNRLLQKNKHNWAT